MMERPEMKAATQRKAVPAASLPSGRLRLLVGAALLVAALLGLGLWASLSGGGAGLRTNLAERSLPPSWGHPLGTDWLGRDMLVRTVQGLWLSLQVGLLASLAGTAIAAAAGLSAALLGRTADRIVSWLMDLFLSLPHLVTLILIAFVCGGGLRGVLIGVALTHWPSLARLIRAEAMQLRSADYVAVSRSLGKSRVWIMTRHLLPHLLPQLLTGCLLLFPHAILHEAAITFIGLGLPPDQPAIGVILSESMRYLNAGLWWLAVFPGVALLLLVGAFDRLGHAASALLDPGRSQQ